MFNFFVTATQERDCLQHICAAPRTVDELTVDNNQEPDRLSAPGCLLGYFISVCPQTRIQLFFAWTCFNNPLLYSPLDKGDVSMTWVCLASSSAADKTLSRNLSSEVVPRLFV